MKEAMEGMCMYVVDEISHREVSYKKYGLRLSAREVEQRNRAKNLLEDLPDWFNMSEEDAKDVTERFKKLVEVNKVLGI